MVTNEIHMKTLRNVYITPTNNIIQRIIFRPYRTRCSLHQKNCCSQNGIGHGSLLSSTLSASESLMSDAASSSLLLYCSLSSVSMYMYSFSIFLTWAYRFSILPVVSAFRCSKAASNAALLLPLLLIGHIAFPLHP